MSEKKVLNEELDSNWKMLSRVREQLSEDGKITKRGD